jgi:hypothetical protein
MGRVTLMDLPAIPSLSDASCRMIPLLRNITYNKRPMSLSSSGIARRSR